MISHRLSAVSSGLPYGVNDLEPRPKLLSRTPKRVRCYVRGCRHELLVPGGGQRGEVCPDHGIRCHHSGYGATYSYTDTKRNIIAAPHTFARNIIGHPFKFESHRLGSENSEDAVSWNVFRSLYEARSLSRLAAMVTGEESTIEPFLYLWGICITADEFEPWNLLIEARKRFEGKLPVERPLTEPDIALHLPGKYLILIEAKFTSFNTFYARGPRKDKSSLTLDELLAIYSDPALKLLNQRQAAKAHRVPYQLWRNTVFAEWMAAFDHPRTRAYHVNLTRESQDADSAAEFATLIQDEHQDRFQRLTWEGIHRMFRQEPQLNLMRRYLETKTAGLKKAFGL